MIYRIRFHGTAIVDAESEKKAEQKVEPVGDTEMTAWEIDSVEELEDE